MNQWGSNTYYYFWGWTLDGPISRNIEPYQDPTGLIRREKNTG